MNGDPERHEIRKFLGEDELDYWDRLQLSLHQKRIVILSGDMDDESERVAREIILLEASSGDPIHVILNSVGGDVYAGLLIHETLRHAAEAGLRIVMETRGLAASMGAIVLQAASPGCRIATKNSRFLIHEVSSVSWGKVSEQKEQVEELDRVNDLLKGILAERCGKARAEIETVWHKKDVWFSAQEAKNFGLVDEVR